MSITPMRWGIPVLVTDHHLPGETLPAAEAIVNPNLRDCDFPSKSLAGVGVAFYLMLALRTFLRDKGWFDARGIAAPNLAELLDLVALGTVADVVPLDANNRILTWQGLSRIRAGKCRPGIKALLEIANRDPQKTGGQRPRFRPWARASMRRGGWMICPSAWRCCCAITSAKRAC
ncbi:hypothetical protein LNP17_25940 [Klebsiella variicola subsp. variicola]|nr:hypothetical protein [Klebsiella variicola subsp. variicola]